MNGRKQLMSPRKPGFPSAKKNPLQREYEEAPARKRGKGSDKPKVGDLPLGDRSPAKM